MVYQKRVRKERGEREDHTFWGTFHQKKRADVASMTEWMLLLQRVLLGLEHGDHALGLGAERDHVNQVE